jgi:hypothetical protein
LRAPVRLPDTAWQLFEHAHPSHVLSKSRTLEDLFCWHHFEAGLTLIHPEVINPAGALPLSAAARQGLGVFVTLFPEWRERQPYMSIRIMERQRRLRLLFGDMPLAIEPFLEEIPPDLYRLLVREKMRGGGAVVRGEKADLVLIKRQHNLPLPLFRALLFDYLTLLDDSEPVPRAETIKLSGKGSRSAQLRHELVFLGKYRLFKANDFNISRTLEAVYGPDHQVRRDNAFYAARKLVERWYANRWLDAEQTFRSLASVVPR